MKQDRASILLLILFGIVIFSEHGFCQEDKALRDGASREWCAPDGTLLFPSEVPSDRLEDRHQSIYDLSQRRLNSSSWPSLSAIWKAVPGLFRGLFFLLLGLLIAGLIYLILTNQWRTWLGRKRIERNGVTDESTKIHDLPFAVELPKSGLLEEAAACRQRGDYSRAIIFLFSYVLVELEKGRVIRLHRGKTNRMYLQEIRSDRVLRSITEKIMLAFEVVFFGKRSLSEEQFEACWSRLGEFSDRIAARMNEIPGSNESKASQAAVAEVR